MLNHFIKTLLSTVCLLAPVIMFASYIGLWWVSLPFTLLWSFLWGRWGEKALYAWYDRTFTS